jgi:hypothetical protein
VSDEDMYEFEKRGKTTRKTVEAVKTEHIQGLPVTVRE